MLTLLVIIAALILIALVFGAAAKVILAAILFPISLALTVLCFWLLFATQAPAANRPYFDGNALLDSCTTNSATEQAHCFAYVLGVADALSIWKKTAPDTSPACPETGVAGAQYRDVGLQYIATKIKERHEPASILLMRAFREQWPCKKPSVTE
jgi:hypothetical protein